MYPFGAQVISYADKRKLAKARAVHRQEEREMRAAGFRRHEADWEINRGGFGGQVILEVKIAAGGRGVWTRCGYPEGDVRALLHEDMFRLVQIYGKASPSIEEIEARGYAGHEWMTPAHLKLPA